LSAAKKKHFENDDPDPFLAVEYYSDANKKIYGQDRLELPFSFSNVPPQVNYALVCYRLYGKAALKEVCDSSSDLRLKRGSNVTIIEHETEGRRFEYRVYGEDHQNLEELEKQERREISFSWKNVGKMLLNSVSISVLGIVASKVFSVPKLGLGDNFSLNVWAAATAAFRGLGTITTTAITSMSESTQFVPNLIVAALAGALLGVFVKACLMGLTDTDDLVIPDDGFTSPSLQLVLMIMGNRFQPLKAMLGSAAMGLAPGIGEEIAFRGVLQTVLARRLSTPQAIVVQAILFGLAHPSSGPYILVTGLLGLLLGTIYAATQNLAIPIFLHSLWNTFMFFRGHVHVSDMTEEEITKLLQGPSIQSLHSFFAKGRTCAGRVSAE
jgi:membrane protease YdiL (CAAX protease family)